MKRENPKKKPMQSRMVRGTTSSTTSTSTSRSWRTRAETQRERRNFPPPPPPPRRPPPPPPTPTSVGPVDRRVAILGGGAVLLALGTALSGGGNMSSSYERDLSYVASQVGVRGMPSPCVCHRRQTGPDRRTRRHGQGRKLRRDGRPAESVHATAQGGQRDRLQTRDAVRASEPGGPAGDGGRFPRARLGEPASVSGGEDSRRPG